MSDSYNGWTNCETWNVALWWGDNGMSGYWIGEAEEMLDDDDSDDVAVQLADRMKWETINEMPEVTGMYADLLKAALDEVNWREIAEHYVADAEFERAA
jgi:hypothetical protein